jgi:uncharacterized protein with WD repeat
MWWNWVDAAQGKNVVLAGLKGLNGQLEFFNVDEFETLASAEHFMCQEVEWDPTGRYVCTSVTSVVSMENGLNVWQFNGKLLYRMMKDRFFKVRACVRICVCVCACGCCHPPEFARFMLAC